MPLVNGLERERDRTVLAACAVLIAFAYVTITFDGSFLLGHGPFWANPRGRWLMDPGDRTEGYDILQVQVGYLGFVNASWQWPVFFVPNLGAPAGTNIIFADAIPIVALLGKFAGGAAGHPVNPYGAWIAACFVLSAVFATLFVVELGQRSLLAAAAASLLAVSAPALLHRFGHLALMGHFVVIGALLLYLLDRRGEPAWTPAARWAFWLCFATMVSAYLFVMAAAVYAASLARRLALSRVRLSVMLLEPFSIVCSWALLITLAGHFGKGTSTGHLGGPGFGQYSMNLLSPVWPQRSGLFPGFQQIIDATGGQYEGFNYLGFGALLLICTAIVLDVRHMRHHVSQHRYLVAALTCLAAFAVSHRVFLGYIKILDLDISDRLDLLVGVFRASGRMFWPMLYAAMLIALVLALRRLGPGPKLALIGTCCLLQLVDTEPLRARVAALSRLDTPRLLDPGEWQARMLRAAAVRVDPPFACGGLAVHSIANLELQAAAMAAVRPINSVYNARRLPIDCTADAASARSGPWRDDTLYVFLRGEPRGVPSGWSPSGLTCEPFTQGLWCLGTKPVDSAK